MKKGSIERRKRVLEYLEDQLKKGKKPEKINDVSTGKLVNLTEEDKKRIQYQIKVLKQRI